MHRLRMNAQRFSYSYSRKDGRWLKRLQVHLKDLERRGLMELWDDTKLQTGTQWRDEISNALDSARVAVLLISADFIASDFIANNELPPLLAKAEKNGVVILPLILSPSRFEKIESLSRFMTVNPPSEPLIELSKAKQERYLVKLSEDVLRAIEEAQKKPTRVVGAERQTPDLSLSSDKDLEIEVRLVQLLRTIREFPERGGSHSSWAVKESDIIKGEINCSIERPGLGIALFTTELASEVFGA